MVLSSSRGQDIIEDLKASRPRTWALRPRTRKCILQDVFEAKDVLKDAKAINASVPIKIIKIYDTRNVE